MAGEKRKDPPPAGWPEDAKDGARYFCLVRHAQALHNVCNDNLWTPDNPLTPAGETMCEDARKEWGEGIFRDAQLIVVSPMMRALQTAWLIAGQPEGDDRWLVTPACSEKLSGATCDEGRPKSELVKAIPWMSEWRGVQELAEEWWKEPREEEEVRVAEFVKFLQKRPEQRIIVVSHGGFLEYVAGFYMQNAEHHIMSLDDSKRVTEKMQKAAFNINMALTREYESRSFKSLRSESLVCLQGFGRHKLSEIQKVGPKTVAGLAKWKFANVAWALCVLAPTQEDGARDFSKVASSMNINKAFDTAWEGCSLSELLEAPPSAFEGLSASMDPHFRSLGIKTVRDLGSWKFYLWARAICELAQVEAPDGSS